MAPSKNSDAVVHNDSSNSNFELLSSLKANELIPVHKYKSITTNLTVVIAEVEGPVVNGYFCLATEAHDDDGLPHTLEHLVFLGSKNYPYKGVLDLLANRCLASGTNAWTDTDHTCYTMTTAGCEGFLTLMPIYIEHVLYPTLTDSGFTTEVHHVTGEGEDAGVVYSEIQGSENTGESRVYMALVRAIYPGRCGYKSETGGKMKNLRDSTDNTKVRNYHKAFYRPENLTLIITGQVKPDAVFKALEPVEKNILSKGDRLPFTRPWQEPVPPFVESVDLEVPYPCDEECNGMVYVGWRGPSAVTDFYKLTACSVLLKYLTDTSVSPLPKKFVEVADPYASKVGYSLIENSVSVLMVQFASVPVARLDAVRGHLSATLESILSNVGSDAIDMARLVTVVHRQRLECLSHLENSPHDSIAFMAIGDMLYGNTTTDLDQRLNQVADLTRMEGEPLEFWLGLLEKYLVSAPSVTVRGMPSVKEQLRMTEEEKSRLIKQREALGEAGLTEKERELALASQTNEEPPPEEILMSVPIPSIESINFHPIKRYTSYSDEQHPLFNTAQVPVYMHIDDVHTNFVYVFVLMDSRGLSRESRLYLPLLFESLLECPLERAGVVVPYEEVIAQLEADTITSATRLGLEASSPFHCGPYFTTASLMLQLEPEKYERGIIWIRELLFQTKFTAERLKVIATKIVNDVAQVKRKGNTIIRDLMKGLLYSKDSNHYAASVLRQHKFLTTMLERLESGEEGTARVLAEMEAVRHILTHPTNMAVHMAANIERLASKVGDVVRPWRQLLPPGHKPAKTKLHVTNDWSLLVPPCDNSNQNCVVGMGAVESSYFCQTTPSIKDFNDPDLAPLLVFLQYLTQTEGPMWRQIRGLGLSYGYNMIPRPNEGLLYLTFYRANNPIAAYKEAKTIVMTRLCSDMKWDQSLFESAKSSLIFEIVEREKSIGDVVAQSLLAYFEGVDHDYNRQLVQLIAKVTTADLCRIGPKYVAPLFDPSKSKTSIVCHPSKTEEVAAGFKELGCDVTVCPSLEESCLSHC